MEIDKGWVVQHNGSYINVLPMGDSSLHIPSSDCDCGIRTEKINNQTIVIHNAFDGRLLVEKAREVLSITENNREKGLTREWFAIFKKLKDEFLTESEDRFNMKEEEVLGLEDHHIHAVLNRFERSLRSALTGEYD